jgi:hypothetical protein
MNTTTNMILAKHNNLMITGIVHFTRALECGANDQDLAVH